jgi:acetyl esterase/lipase
MAQKKNTLRTGWGLSGALALILSACQVNTQIPGREELPLASNPAPIAVAATTVTEDRLPQASVKLGSVQVQTDIVYSTVAGFRPLRLDLYTPDAQGPRPLVIFIHGGGWTTGMKRTTSNFSDFPGVLAGLAEHGFSVASIEYRLSSEAPFPAAVLDAKAAVRFLRANAARFGIDPARIAIWGGSAGAHLTAMTALSCNDPRFVAEDVSNATVSDCVQAWVGWYGPYDITEMLQASIQAANTPGLEMSAQAKAETEGGIRFFGCTLNGCPDGVLTQASPIAYVDAKDPMVILLHGTADTLVPHAQSEMLLRKLQSAGVKSELILIDGVGHGWVGSEHKKTESASRQAVSVTSDWLVQQLQPTTK